MPHHAHQRSTAFRGPLDRQRRLHETPLAAIAERASLNRVIVYAIADPANPSYQKRARNLGDRHFEALAMALSALSGQAVSAADVRSERDAGLARIDHRRGRKAS